MKKRRSDYKNIVGQKFNRLLVIENIQDRKKVPHVKCQCVCGQIIETAKNRVASGRTKSCGCILREHLARVHKKITKHGKSRSRVYKIWATMKDRCHNPKSRSYENYGGRGIKVCKEWHDFNNFYEDMGEKPTRKHCIERIDNDKGYNPSNCKWVTNVVQSNNKRDNVFIEFKGVKRTIAQWARILEIKEITLWGRLNKSKWAIEKAFNTPVRGSR